VWFATLVALADGLNRVGFVTWFAKKAAAPLAGYAPLTVTILLAVLFFVTHYMFASITAHVTAMLPSCSPWASRCRPRRAVVRDAPLLHARIMGILTPYATGPSPVYFGSGFVSRKDFWRLGRSSVHLSRRAPRDRGALDALDEALGLPRPPAGSVRSSLTEREAELV